MRVLLVLALLALADGINRRKANLLASEDDPVVLATAQKSVEGFPVKQRLKSDEGYAYYGTLHVGGRPQMSIYDTGSFELVLASTCGTATVTQENQCCSHEKCPYANYESKHSGKYSEDPDMELSEITYGSGPVTVRSGYDHVAINDDDTLTFGAGNGYHLATDKMSVQVIVDHDIDLFKSSQLQAIVGIGPGEFAGRKQRMLYELGIKRYMICFRENTGEDGYITWNDKDRSADQSTWIEVPVPGKVFWAVPTSKFRLVGKKGWFGTDETKLGCDPSCGAIIDSGTSLITPPTEVIEALKEKLESSDIEDCSDLSQFPTFEFKLGDKSFSLPPSSYIADAGVGDVEVLHQNLAFKPLPMTKAALNTVKAARERGEKTPGVHRCALLLSEGDATPTQFGPMVILGMSLFRKYAVQFDMTADLEDRESSFDTGPTRFMRLAEATSDCSGSLHGSRFRETSQLQKVNLDRLRASPLQQRLAKHSKTVNGQRQMHQL